LSATLFWNYPSVTAAVAHLAERLDLTAAAVPPSRVEESELDRLFTEIQGLTDDEVRTLLANSEPSAPDE
jgi:hypothetical protein